MSLFRDSTGRPGPAGWALGEYPQGQDDFPVSGVSWYEAAAYAEFVGKALPTLYHWDRAAAIWTSDTIVPASNFKGNGPARVGSYQGMSPMGLTTWRVTSRNGAGTKQEPESDIFSAELGMSRHTSSLRPTRVRPLTGTTHSDFGAPNIRRRLRTHSPLL